MAGELSRDDMRRLARLGAMRRLEELRREEGMIRAAFPELFDGRAPQAGRAPGPASPAGASKKTRKRRVSAAARKAVSERMKKYWAERRKAKAKATGKGKA